MGKTITTSVQREGFEAILYPGNGRKDKVMIVMSGSNGGMTLTKQESKFYHRNGIPSLALALFKTKQTLKELSRVPVEYVEKVILKAVFLCGFCDMLPYTYTDRNTHQNDG